MNFHIALTLTALWFLPAVAVDDSQLNSVKAADEKRVAAIKNPERERLNTIFSDDLRYAHSTGTLDTKDSFIEVLVSGKTKYVDYAYEERNFTFPAPGIALMTGRARVKVLTAAGESENLLSFLSVWREEKGQWRFLAWQSCKIPPPPTTP